MFKDDSINLTYKRLQLLETNDKYMRGVGGWGGGIVKCTRFTVVQKGKMQRKCRIRLPLGDFLRVRSQRHKAVCTILLTGLLLHHNPVCFNSNLLT